MASITEDVERVGSDTPPSRMLTDEEVELFWERGYHVIRDALSPDEISHYRRLILDLVPRDLTFPASWSCSMGRMKPYQVSNGERDQTIDTPELLPLLGNPKCYAVAAQLLGSRRLRVLDGSLGITLRNDAASPSERSQRLHIDASVPLDKEFTFTLEEVQLGGCYYLNDVGEQCGGIHIVPGGHRRVEEEVRSHSGGRHLYNDWKDIPYDDSVEMTGRAGDFVMLHHLMPHAASHNRHPTPRVAQFTRWVRTDQPYDGSTPARAYNEHQLAAMSPLCQRLLGVRPW